MASKSKQTTTKPLKTRNKKTLSVTSPRSRKLTKKQSRARVKKLANSRKPISGSFSLSITTLRFIKQNIKIFAGIVIVYLILNTLLVRGLGGGVDVTGLKETIKQTIHGNAQEVRSAASVYSQLINGSGAANQQSGSAAQSFLLIFESLVIITALRKLFSGGVVKLKEVYYFSTGQLVPFIMVLLVIVVQLIPLIIGSSLYQLVGNNGLAVSAAEQWLWGGLFLVLAFWSIRMISVSLPALYIVTLPDMTPKSALRSSKKLVNYRRFAVARRILFLPLVIFVSLGVIIIPLIIFWTSAVEPVFYILSTSALLFGHAYLYHLYRELLQ